MKPHFLRRAVALGAVALLFVGCDTPQPTSDPTATVVDSSSSLAVSSSTAQAPTTKAPQSTTPNAFYSRGAPTFVIGTAGDERSDREIAAQVWMVRDMLFPSADVIEDVAIDVAPRFAHEAPLTIAARRSKSSTERVSPRASSEMPAVAA